MKKRKKKRKKVSKKETNKQKKTATNKESKTAQPSNHPRPTPKKTAHPTIPTDPPLQSHPHLSAVLQVGHGAHQDTRYVLVVAALLLYLCPQLLHVEEGRLAGDGEDQHEAMGCGDGQAPHCREGDVACRVQ